MLKPKIQDVLTGLAHFLQKQPHGRALVLKLDSFVKQANQARSRNQHMNNHQEKEGKTSKHQLYSRNNNQQINPLQPRLRVSDNERCDDLPSVPREIKLKGRHV